MSVSPKIFRKGWRTGVAKEKEQRGNEIHTGIRDLEHYQKTFQIRLYYLFKELHQYLRLQKTLQLKFFK